MKTKQILLITIALLLLLHSVLAFNVYIRPPRMIARMNLTESQTYEGFLEVKNNNNIPVNVTFRPTGNITDKIKFSQDVISMQPNETKQVEFKLNVKEPGYYAGNVIVTYIAENTVPIGLQAEIIILAEGYPKPPKNNLLLYVAGLITVVVVTLILIKIKKKGFRK